MSSSGIIELCDHDEIGESNGENVRTEPNSISGASRLKINYKIKKLQLLESVEDRSSNAFSTAQTNSTVLDQGVSPVDESSLSSAGPIGPAPITRQFWKAGDYDGGQGYHTASQNGKNYLCIHPMFLHSNATSHKWVFGAIAELLDNSVDEIQNGATFVAIDKTSNPRDGSPGLLIQDDGGGMDPEAIRRCMSFGYSDKKLKIAIGQYGNGFKTSSMRLGADAIVFSRHLKNRKQTQSIGLLSYTFLRQMGHDRLVVPMVDYEFNASARTFEAILSHGKEHFSSNLSTLLQWSPYSTAEELLKQFDNIGHHGTKVIVYNLWLNSDGDMELDFSSHSEDIRIKGDSKLFQAQHFSFPIKDLHIANLYRYSLRAYTSILYLRIPQSFRIVLRGRIVEPRNIASDLRYPEFIMYKPQLGGNVEAKVLTTLGFWKDCPHVHFHGFSIYHRNRLVLPLCIDFSSQPFWSVIKHTNGIGRGVVGVLEANFMEPTHNKQDFEKTSLFQKLEARLKEMQVEYWHLHCTLIGYQTMKKVSPPLPSQDIQSSRTQSYQKQSVSVSNNSCGYDSLKVASSTVESFQNSVFTPSYVPAKRARSQPGLNAKKKKQNLVAELNECNGVAQSADVIENQLQNQETVGLLQEQRRLKSLLLQIEQREEELNLKVQRLRSELEDVQHQYAKLLAELNKMDITKEEKNANAYYEKENHCL